MDYTTFVGQVNQIGKDSAIEAQAIQILLNLAVAYGGDSDLANSIIAVDTALQALIVASVTTIVATPPSAAVAAMPAQFAPVVVTPASPAMPVPAVS